jgi:hypothetical protein
LILCEYLVGVGGNNAPTIILNGQAGYIGDDLSLGRCDLITRLGRKDLILELVDEDGVPCEWVSLVELPHSVTELLETGRVVGVIDGHRELGIVNPARGEASDNGVVNYAT